MSLFRKEKVSKEELEALTQRAKLQEIKALELQILKNELDFQFRTLLNKYQKQGTWTISLKTGVMTEVKTQEKANISEKE